MTGARPDAPARDRIRTALDETLFVEAGAGSGKTSALVDRVMALVIDGDLPLATIAAITFTEKAATELRDRIRVALDARFAEARPTHIAGVRRLFLGPLKKKDQRALGEAFDAVLRGDPA